LAEQAELQEKIEAANAWELERELEVAADALRLPPWDADVAKLSGGEKSVPIPIQLASLFGVNFLVFPLGLNGFVFALTKKHPIPHDVRCRTS
jgi:hypothetical protein